MHLDRCSYGAFNPNAWRFREEEMKRNKQA